MTHPNDRAAKLAQETRRREVAALLLAGVTDQTVIAGRVKVNKSTICRDVKAIEADWRERIAADIASVKGRDDARLDRLYAAAVQQALAGNVGAINACVKILARRAAMWGYDAPAKVEVNVRDYAERLAIEAGCTADDLLADAEAIAAAAWERVGVPR